MNKVEERIVDLSLLLLFLNSWEEEGFDYDENEKFVKKKFRRTWKDCSYGVLKILDERGYIFNNYKSKSIVITDAGIQKALEIYQALYHEPYEIVQ